MFGMNDDGIAGSMLGSGDCKEQRDADDSVDPSRNKAEVVTCKGPGENRLSKFIQRLSGWSQLIVGTKLASLKRNTLSKEYPSCESKDVIIGKLLRKYSEK